MHEDEVLTQDLDKANYFNKFFSSVAFKLKDSVTEPTEPQEIPKISMNPHTLFMMPTSEKEVPKIIQVLKNKSGGCDGMHAFILKPAASFIAPVLAHIINNAISLGVIPSQFKTAEVYKNGSK